MTRPLPKFSWPQLDQWSGETSPRRRARPAPAPRKPTKPPYDRKAQLPKLIGLWPRELEDCSEAGTLRVIALLRKALRSERQRGVAGHWTYDVSRHLALVEAMREERARLSILQRLPVRIGRGGVGIGPKA